MMEILLYGTLLFSFLFALCGICLSVWAISLSTHLKTDWLERIAEINQAFADVEAEKALLKTTLEKIHTLHVQRQDDLEPIHAKLNVLESRTSAISANQNKRPY